MRSVKSSVISNRGNALHNSLQLQIRQRANYRSAKFFQRGRQLGESRDLELRFFAHTNHSMR